MSGTRSCPGSRPAARTRSVQALTGIRRGRDVPPSAPPDAARDRTIRRLYKSGLSIRRVAKQLNHTPHLVTVALKRLGVPMRPSGWPPPPPSRDKRIAALYRKGRGVASVAETVGVSQFTAWSTLQRLRVPMRPTGPRTGTHWSLTLRQERDIVRLYAEGSSIQQTADTVGCDDAVAYRLLVQRGVERRSPGGQQEVSQRLFDRAERLYEGGVSMAVAAAKVGVNGGTVASYFRRVGIERRSEPYRLYTLDESAFDVMTAEAAYWVGFLMADGCVFHRAKGSPRISITLKGADKGHLYKFRRFLGSNAPIRTFVRNGGFGRRSQTEFGVKSQRLADALRTYGVVPRKTATARVRLLADNRHFWRGVIDGDGWIRVPRRGRPPYDLRLGLVGSKFLTRQFRVFARAHVPTRAHVLPRPQRELYYFGVGSRLAAELCRVLYDDAPVALARKAKKAARASCLYP